MGQGYDEKHEERYGVADKSHRAARTDVLAVYIVNDVKYAEYAGEEEYGKAEYYVPSVEQGVESVAGVGPAADYGACEGFNQASWRTQGKADVLAQALGGLRAVLSPKRGAAARLYSTH